MTQPNIKNLSVAELLSLRGAIDTALQSKKAELHSQLAEIDGGQGLRTRKTKGAKVAAKYRHPVTGETWSGRGGVVRWLAEEIKAGKNKDDFLIANSGKKGVKKAGKRGRPKKASRK
ncbi:MAG TPA: H-NS family nucleoid-associated regulatory protein [Xanthobacteraceae bacterium]|nr:H-NS family nucleoid-associated regulatory protein [Xanthobacteraceae bacterium]